MKSSVRKLIEAVALSTLLFGVSAAGAMSPVEAVQGIRPVPTICVWEDLDWNEMSIAEHRQWATLGWTQRRWESDEESAYPASAFKDWEDLSISEQAAAWSLGFTPRSWDSEEACP